MNTAKLPRGLTLCFSDYDCNGLVGVRGPNIWHISVVKRYGMPFNRSGNWKRGVGKMAGKMAGELVQPLVLLDEGALVWIQD